MKQLESSWDLFRLSKSKEVVDLTANTLRNYFAQGLPSYRCGKVVFVSRSELERFIRSGRVQGLKAQGLSATQKKKGGSDEQRA